MSYPINQAITYTAVASTVGMPANTFTYAWAFDDGGTGNTASLSHTWTTGGNHTATITATDNTTLGVATASKTISTVDWSTLAWTSTGVKIAPTASTGTTPEISITNRLLISGNYLINWYDNQYQNVIVTYDTVGGTRAEYDMGTSIATAFVPRVGPNAGNVIIVLRGVTTVKILNPVTGIVTTSPNACSYTPYAFSTTKSFYCEDANGDFYVGGRNSGSTNSFCKYSSMTDTWATKTASTRDVAKDIADAFLLPSGKIFTWRTTFATPEIYDPTLNTWSSGVAFPFTPTNKPIFFAAPSKMIYCVTLGTNPVFSSWNEGDVAWASKTSVYPLGSQQGSATQNIYQVMVATPDGFYVNIGGTVLTGLDQGDTKTIFHGGSAFDSWVVGVNLLSSGPDTKLFYAYLNGKIWRATSSSAILEYMAWS